MTIPAKEPEQVQELPRDSWTPLTPELLHQIEAGEHGTRFWIAGPNETPTEPLIGTYRWYQGRNPHGFNIQTDDDDENGWRVSSASVTHVMPFVPPRLPWER